MSESVARRLANDGWFPFHSPYAVSLSADRPIAGSTAGRTPTLFFFDLKIIASILQAHNRGTLRTSQTSDKQIFLYHRENVVKCVSLTVNAWELAALQRASAQFEIFNCRPWTQAMFACPLNPPYEKGIRGSTLNSQSPFRRLAQHECQSLKLVI